MRGVRSREQGAGSRAAAAAEPSETAHAPSGESIGPGKLMGKLGMGFAAFFVGMALFAIDWRPLTPPCCREDDDVPVPC